MWNTKTERQMYLLIDLFIDRFKNLLKYKSPFGGRKQNQNFVNNFLFVLQVTVGNEG